MNFLVMPMFFLSGALFPLAGLPRSIGLVARIDPLSYGVDGIRGALVGGSHFTLIVDAGVLGAFVVVLLTIGSYLFSRIQV